MTMSDYIVTMSDYKEKFIFSNHPVYWKYWKEKNIFKSFNLTERLKKKKKKYTVEKKICAEC